MTPVTVTLGRYLAIRAAGSGGFEPAFFDDWWQVLTLTLTLTPNPNPNPIQVCTHPSWQRRLGIICALLFEQQRHALGQG